jgi:hypothetical protein
VERLHKENTALIQEYLFLEYELKKDARSKKQDNIMMPKEFIQKVLIDEIRDIVFRHPFLAFGVIAIGIEYLGKCAINSIQDWHSYHPGVPFAKGLDLMCEDEPRYKDLNLRNELRNGFAHTLMPGTKIAL